MPVLPNVAQYGRMTGMAELPQLSMRQILGSVPLRRLTAAQLVSMAGDFLAIFAVFSVVSFELHGTAAQVTGIMIAYMLPQAFAGPLAGVFVDRRDVKTTMITSDLVRAGLVACLVYSSSIWQIYGVMILLSAISAFFMPAQTITIRTIVPVNGLMAANALMMLVMQLTQIVTPGVAGLLVNHAGAATCFWLDSASFLFSAAMVFGIPIPRKSVPSVKAVSSVVADVTRGGRYIFSHRVLAFTVLAMAAGGFAVSFYNALMPIYVRDVLRGSAELYGVLGTLVGVGTIIGAQGMTRLGKFISNERLVPGGLFGVALGILLLAIGDRTSPAVIATLGMGFGVALVIVPAQTLMQAETPVEMLGRVSGSVRSVLALVQIAGLVLSGSIAQAIGIRGSWLAVSVLLALFASAGLGVLNGRGRSLYSFSRSTLR
jgi:DHA3 family macrolide efflux protein-like MFS transporter